MLTKFKQKLSVIRHIQWPFALFALVLLVTTNLLLDNHSRTFYKQQVTLEAEKILDNLEKGLELPLLVNDAETIQNILASFNSYSHIYHVTIQNRAKEPVAERYYFDNKFSKNPDLRFQRDVFQTQSVDTLGDESFVDMKQGYQPKIGYLDLQMSPYSAGKSFFKSFAAVKANLILLSIILLFWLWNRKKSYGISQDIQSLDDILNNRLLQKTKTMESRETLSLFNSVKETNKNLEHARSESKRLKNEIRYSQEDGNIELHQVAYFLKNFDKFKDDHETSLLIEAITDTSLGYKDYIDIVQSLKSILMQHSKIAELNGVLVLDNYFDTVIENQVLLNKAAFERFFKLFYNEILSVCHNDEIQISVDINVLEKSSKILRISIESSAPEFLKAIETQSLFDFDPSNEQSATINNVNLIASKYILRKAGGDYLYLKDELRFEFPISTQMMNVSATSLPLISPLPPLMNILVYDSDPIDRLVLMGYLEKFEQEVDKATTKEVALQKIRRQEYNLLCVSEDFFSENDPYFAENFLTEIKNKSYYLEIVVIADSYEISSNDFINALSPTVIKKPVDIGVLGNHLKNLQEKLSR